MNREPLTIDSLIEVLTKLRANTPVGGETPVCVCSPECEPLPVAGVSASLTNVGPAVMLMVDGITVW